MKHYLNAKQQFLKTLIERGYSTYQINKDNLINLASKSTLYYHRKNKENWRLERRLGSSRKHIFDESVKLEIKTTIF